MTITYHLEENDYLTHQLFIASKSERIRKKRQRIKYLYPLIYGAFGFWFFLQDKYSLALVFINLGLLWFFIYPIWERRHYVKHYKGFIKENYKDRFGRNATIEISNDFIVVKDHGMESKVLTSEIEEINEIPSIIFVRLKGGQSLILPKDKIAEIGNLRIRLQELANYLKINYVVEENWNWK
jgi:hypothetical protein